MSWAIATLLGVGHLRPAPGTWGSLAAIPLAWLLVLAGGWIGLAVAIPTLFVAGYWATTRETAGKDDHDPSEIVVDEVVGQWIALLPVAIGASLTGAGFWSLWPGILTAFVAFRLFDITKPGPVGWADRRNDALGVMLDDIIAGWLAAMVVAVAAVIGHGLTGA